MIIHCSNEGVSMARINATRNHATDSTREGAHLGYLVNMIIAVWFLSAENLDTECTYAGSAHKVTIQWNRHTMQDR